MMVFVRFEPDAGVDAGAIEDAAQACVGRAGSVIGASVNSIDIEVADPSEVRPLLQSLAAALRELGLPASTQLDVPSSGQRFSIFDF